MLVWLAFAIEVQVSSRLCHSVSGFQIPSTPDPSLLLRRPREAADDGPSSGVPVLASDSSLAQSQSSSGHQTSRWKLLRSQCLSKSVSKNVNRAEGELL